MPRLPPVQRFVSSMGARIYRIACEALPGLSGRVYLILGAGPPTLVDAGSGEGRCTEQIVAALEAIPSEFGEDFQPRQIERILVTHAHLDHIGGLADLVNWTGAKVGVHPLDAPVVSNWDEQAAVFNRRLVDFLHHAGVPDQRHAILLELFGFTPGRMRSVPVDFLLDEHTPPEGLRLIHTPGHSPGHVCILLDDVLICGDHILARTIPQQWPESFATFTGHRHYVASLKKILRTEGVRLALGGHESVIGDIRHRIFEILAAQERRLQRVVEIVGNSDAPRSLVEIAQRLYGHQKGFFELLALIDVGSKVEYLKQLGRLEMANCGELCGNPRLPARYLLSRTDSSITTIAPTGKEA